MGLTIVGSGKNINTWKVEKVWHGIRTILFIIMVVAIKETKIQVTEKDDF